MTEIADLVGGVIVGAVAEELTVHKDGLAYQVSLIEADAGPDSQSDGPPQTWPDWYIEGPVAVTPDPELAPKRQGLAWVLATNPAAEIQEVRDQGDGPWLLVDMTNKRRRETFCIWKRTGAVHRLGPGGAVEDDPVFIP